jgi:ribosomal protein S14
MLHPIKAELMRKDQKLRAFLGNSGGPKPSDEDLWDKQHAKFVAIQSNCPQYRTEPPDSPSYDDNDCPDDCEGLNFWYYQQLHYTSQGVIRQKYLDKLVKVYPLWETIARRIIRDGVRTAPKSLRQAQYETNKEQCGACGEHHEYAEIVFMICRCCKKEHYIKPACIDKTRDECVAMMTGCEGPFWKCSECEEGSD